MTRAWEAGMAVLIFVPALLGEEPMRLQGPDENLSLRLEIEHHLDRGAAWLRGCQNRDSGAWGEVRSMELTGLALTALLGLREHPQGDLDADLTGGFRFLQAGLALPECREQEAAGRIWMHVLPAMFFLAHRSEMESLIRAGAAELRMARFLDWEEEFRRGEVLRTVRLLGFAGESGGTSPSGADLRPAEPGGARWRYWRGLNLSEEARPGEELESWRKEVRVSFAEDLRSRDVSLLEVMAKALHGVRMQRVADGKGGEMDWREPLAVRLFDLQRRDGAWPPDSPSAFAGEDVIEATSRALLALQTLVDSL